MFIVLVILLVLFVRELYVPIEVFGDKGKWVSWLPKVLCFPFGN